MCVLYVHVNILCGFCQPNDGDVKKKKYIKFQKACTNSYHVDEKSVVRKKSEGQHTVKDAAGSLGSRSLSESKLSLKGSSNKVTQPVNHSLHDQVSCSFYSVHNFNTVRACYKTKH